MKRNAKHQAILDGAAHYSVDYPCANGHLALRKVAGGCVVCRLERDRKRMAENRAAYNARKRRERVGKESVLAQKARAARAVESAEKRAVRLEKARVAARAWRESNPNHPGARKAKTQYKKRNADRVRADTIKRRVSKMNRTPSWVGAEELWLIKEAYALAVLREKVFGFSWHVDHTIPLQGALVSGLHVPENLQVIPWRDNVAKANRYIP